MSCDAVDLFADHSRHHSPCSPSFSCGLAIVAFNSLLATNIATVVFE